MSANGSVVGWGWVALRPGFLPWDSRGPGLISLEQINNSEELMAFVEAARKFYRMGPAGVSWVGFGLDSCCTPGCTRGVYQPKRNPDLVKLRQQVWDPLRDLARGNERADGNADRGHEGLTTWGAPGLGRAFRATQSWLA